MGIDRRSRNGHVQNHRGRCQGSDESTRFGRHELSSATSLLRYLITFQLLIHFFFQGYTTPN